MGKTGFFQHKEISMTDTGCIIKCLVCRRVYKTEKDFLTNTSRWHMCNARNLWFRCSCDTTLMLKKGQCDWYSPERFMSDEARSIFNSLTTLKALPFIPQGVMELQQLIQQKNVTSLQLAKVVKKEPIIAANVMGIANKLIAFRENESIKSLDHAISYVGMHTFEELIVLGSVQALSLSCTVFNGDDFWNESFLVGSIAEQLAKKFAPKLVADEVYLAGTLCNIGKLVTAICLPEVADKMAADEANPDILSGWVATERKYNVPSHQILGEIASSLWGLPEFVTHAARFHHWHRHDFSADRNLLVEIVCLANQIGHWISLMPSKIDRDILEIMAKKRGIATNSAIESLVDSLMYLGKIK